MARDSHLDKLGDVPLFSACSRKDLQRMATDTQVEAAAADSAKGRIRPHQLVFGIGVVVAVGTAMSWVLSNVIFDFQEKSHIHREVFGDIPDAWVVVFYSLTPILILYG